MAGTEIHRIRTISELHQMMGLSRPEHPLISVINLDTANITGERRPGNLVFDFYAIALKRHGMGKVKYGQHLYHFDEGPMHFMAPGQVFGWEATSEIPKPSFMSGWILYIHPDFLWNTPLAKVIKQYEYFDYSVNETLFLTEAEEKTVINLMQNIQKEYLANTDQFSQNIIISLIEALLNYAERFYRRQFLTRKIENHQLLDLLEAILTDWFDCENLLTRGLPGVQDIAEQLHVSPNYLSTLLKVLTGRNTQQHIQDKLIATAKERISMTDLSVNEISYAMGFDHPQSFIRLFKAKTGLSPLAFRQTFN